MSFYFILKNNFLYTENQILLLYYICNSGFVAGDYQECYDYILSLDLSTLEKKVIFNQKWTSEITPYDYPILYNSMNILQVLLEHKLTAKDYWVIVEILQVKPKIQS